MLVLKKISKITRVDSYSAEQNEKKVNNDQDIRPPLWHKWAQKLKGNLNILTIKNKCTQFNFIPKSWPYLYIIYSKRHYT